MDFLTCVLSVQDLFLIWCIMHIRRKKNIQKCQIFCDRFPCTIVPPLMRFPAKAPPSPPERSLIRCRRDGPKWGRELMYFPVSPIPPQKKMPTFKNRNKIIRTQLTVQCKGPSFCDPTTKVCLVHFYVIGCIICCTSLCYSKTCLNWNLLGPTFLFGIRQVFSLCRLN